MEPIIDLRLTNGKTYFHGSYWYPSGIERRFPASAWLQTEYEELVLERKVLAAKDWMRQKEIIYEDKD